MRELEPARLPRRCQFLVQIRSRFAFLSLTPTSTKRPQAEKSIPLASQGTLSAHCLQRQSLRKRTRQTCFGNPVKPALQCALLTVRSAHRAQHLISQTG